VCKDSKKAREKEDEERGTKEESKCREDGKDDV
jgi:hypothetical protein